MAIHVRIGARLRDERDWLEHPRTRGARAHDEHDADERQGKHAERV
jgi:hypothetical protein